MNLTNFTDIRLFTRHNIGIHHPSQRRSNQFHLYPMSGGRYQPNALIFNPRW